MGCGIFPVILAADVINKVNLVHTLPVTNIHDHSLLTWDVVCNLRTLKLPNGNDVTNCSYGNFDINSINSVIDRHAY